MRLVPEWLREWWIRAWSTAEHGMIRPAGNQDQPAVTLEASPSGGTFTISDSHRTSEPIPYNAPPGWPRDPANRSISDLEDRFRTHPLTTAARRAAPEMIREECLGLARVIDELMPNCREKSTAITNLEQVMFWSNAGIARQPDGGGS